MESYKKNYVKIVNLYVNTENGKWKIPYNSAVLYLTSDMSDGNMPAIVE